MLYFAILFTVVFALPNINSERLIIIQALSRDFTVTIPAIKQTISSEIPESVMSDDELGWILGEYLTIRKLPTIVFEALQQHRDLEDSVLTMGIDHIFQLHRPDLHS